MAEGRNREGDLLIQYVTLPDICESESARETTGSHRERLGSACYDEICDFFRGEVREWLNRAVSKTVEPLRVPWVRIPPSPPYQNQ